MHGRLDEGVMTGLVVRIDAMHRLAERSPGFVWRLRGPVPVEALRVFEDYFVPFEPERLFFNLSVWDSVDALRQFVFETAHADLVRGKRAWIDHFNRAHLALWWIPVGHVPTVSESAARLRAVHERGSTAEAFTLSEPHEHPV